MDSREWLNKFHRLVFFNPPGLWNNVTAGAISGSGKIRVVPYDATTSDLSISQN